MNVSKKLKKVRKMLDSYKTIVRIYGLVFGTLLMSMGLQMLFLRYYSGNLIEGEDMIIEKKVYLLLEMDISIHM